MDTFRVTKPFALSAPKPIGDRIFVIGDKVTRAELGAHFVDVEHCLTETDTAAPAPLEPATEPEL